MAMEFFGTDIKRLAYGGGNICAARDFCFVYRCPFYLFRVTSRCLSGTNHGNGMTSRWPSITFGSLSNDDGGAEDNAWWKVNLYFTWESRNYPDLFSVSIRLETCSTWLCKESVQPQIEMQKYRRRRLFSKIHRIWSFRVVVLQSMAKKCTKIQKAQAELLFCSINLLFVDVLIHVVVVVCLSSLLTMVSWKVTFDNHQERTTPHFAVLVKCLTNVFAFIMKRNIFNNKHCFPFKKVTIWTIPLQKTSNLDRHNAPNLCNRCLDWIVRGIHLNSASFEVPSDVCYRVAGHVTMKACFTSKDCCLVSH